MRKLEQIKEELHDMQMDFEELSTIWEQCNAMYKDENGDITIPEDTANRVSILLGF